MRPRSVSTWGVIWVGRTLTSANSAATKKPFRPTRKIASASPQPRGMSRLMGGPVAARTLAIIRDQPKGRQGAAAVKMTSQAAASRAGRSPGRVRPDWSRMAKGPKLRRSRRESLAASAQASGGASEHWVRRPSGRLPPEAAKETGRPTAGTLPSLAPPLACASRASSAARSASGRGGRRRRSPRSALPRAPGRGSRAAARCAPRSGQGR